MATHPSFSGTAQQRRGLCLFLLCTVMACLCLSFWFTNQLYANDNQPEALGAIAGVIRDPSGQPLAGAQVSLWLSQPYGTNGWNVIRTVTTQVDGSYRFSLLPIGVYRVSAADPQGRYGSRFYPTGNAIQQADDIPLAGNLVTGVDLSLQTAGRILGTVTVAAPYTSGYIVAELRQRVDTPIGTTWEYVQSYGGTGTNGVFTFTGLAPNSYRVCASAYGIQFSAFECYDNVYTLDKATDLTLTSGATISNVAIVLGDGANYAQISGRVTTPDGTPLANLDVYAFPVVNPLFPYLTSSATWAAAQQRSTALLAAPDDYGSLHTHTDANGEYQLSTVAAGNYRLQFIDPTGAYTFGYYKNARLASEATILTVAETQVITDADTQLTVAGHIAGRVTFQNQPAANTSVLAELQLTDGSWQAITQTVTNPNTGQYHIGGLPAGTYRISAQATIYDQYSAYQPYGVYGGKTPDDAADILVTTGSRVENIDVTLAGPRFDGSISGRVTTNGTPVAGAKVALYNGNNLCCGYQLPTPTLYTFTNANGDYTFTGLANGAFVIRVSDPAGRYTTMYYPNQIGPGQAELLYMQDSQVMTGINFTVTVAGALSGHIQTREGKAVAGLYIQLNWADPKQYGYVNIPIESRTDATGHYTITGLYPGNYTICFLGQVYYYNECYGGIEYIYGSYGPQPVTVTAGKTTTDIDVIWGPDFHTYLPFIPKP